ncbi:MAG: VCBS repeat-containing protein [Pirellulales bacterium]
MSQIVFTRGPLLLGLFAVLTAASVPAGEPTFKKHQLDTAFRSEGVAAGDFNHDGQMDIAAGSVYYAAPDWTMHTIDSEPREFDPAGYSNTFCNFSDDLNGDGWDDLIVVDFPGKETWWFENPGESGGEWQRHVVVPVTNNESPSYLDVDGDGQRELLYGTGETTIALARPSDDADALWDVLNVSKPMAPGTDRFSHGIGAGDVNGDGRNDVLVIQGWWEAPADPATTPWTFHPASFGDACSQMHVYDFDGDGDNDVLTTSAHNYGMWWHEQTEDGFVQHEISRDFSQTHSVVMTDFNEDGLPDFVTGKRWWAHGGHDPGGDQPAVVYWFELVREDGAAKWIPHVIDHDSGVGTQFEVADINGDGHDDVITSNKKGVFYLERVAE